MKKNFLRLTAFVLLLGIACFGMNDVLRPKGVVFDNFKSFYSLPDQSVDILFLGSSHALCSFEPAVLWEEYGISSFLLSSPSQPVMLSYYNLKEALKTQRPSIIVLEGFGCRTGKPSDALAKIQMNTLAMKFSQNKMDSVQATIEPQYFLETMIGLITYHSRYPELQKDDFLPYPGKGNSIGIRMGQQLASTVKPIGPPDDSFVFPPGGASPMQETVEIYYRKIIELCASYNIPIVVVIAPYQIGEEHSSVLLSAEKIASEYGIDYINSNYVYDEIDLDFLTDFYDEGHLNYRGADKFTRFLADYLTDNYPLPDHRGDPLYSSWDMNAKWQTQSKANFELSNTSALYDYLHLLSLQDDLVVVASLVGDYQDIQNVDLPSLLSTYGIDVPSSGIAVCQNGKTLHRSGQAFDQFNMELGSYDLSTVYDFAREKTSIVVDRNERQTIENGLTFLVYDPYTDTIVDFVGFDATNHYAAIR